MVVHTNKKVQLIKLIELFSKHTHTKGNTMIQIEFTVSRDESTEQVFKGLYESIKSSLFLIHSINEFDIYIKDKYIRDDVTNQWCKTDKVIIINIANEV